MAKAPGKPLSDLSRRFIELEPGKSLCVKTRTERNRIQRVAYQRGLPCTAWVLVRGGYRVWKEK